MPQANITRLLRLLVAVPLVALLGFAGLALAGSVQRVTAAGDFRALVELSTHAGAVIRVLQTERVSASIVLATTSERAQTDFTTQVARTEAAIAVFQRHRASVDDLAVLRRVDAGLAGLAGVRERVRSSPTASLSAIAFSYRIVIADLIAFREALALKPSAAIAGEIRAAAAVTRAGEALGQLQVIVLRTLAGGEVTPAAHQEIAGARARFTEAGAEFAAVARPAWSRQWEQASATERVIDGQLMGDDLGRALPGDRLGLEATAWAQATDSWISELYGVQRVVDATIEADVAAGRGAELRRAAAESAGILLALAVTAALSSAIARWISRRLRRLRSSTMAACEGLPDVVRRLGSAPGATIGPDEAADHAVAELVVDGEDEIADVGRALRSLYYEAVRVAAEQAAMRVRVAGIFVDLSRREQRLVDAMLATVDDAERDETDPARLDHLYTLDHLATRMARTNRSLLVLGGLGVSRVRPEPVALVKVVQAAQSQIEQYTRVRLGPVDGTVMVVGQSVDELVHLLAELLDNATGYSSPGTEVLVTGRVLGERFLLQVLDEGVGISPRRCEQLNAQLAETGEIDLTILRSMGLTVVGHLAARHGVRVTLRARDPIGTVAEVVLPAAVLAPVATSSLVLAARGMSDDRNAGFRPDAAPLFHAVAPGASGIAERSQVEPGTRVNGWFKTSFDGDHAVVTWPRHDGPQHPPNETAPPMSGSGLPRRTPKQVSFTRPRQPDTGPAPKLDPTVVAASMAAYAKGVAGYRAPYPPGAPQ